MIKVIITKEGLLVPIIVCDVCNKQIEDVMHAYAVNPNRLALAEETPSEVLYAHRGKCQDIAEARMQEQYGMLAGSEELSTHVYLLCYNLGLTPQWFQDRDRQFEEFGM